MNRSQTALLLGLAAAYDRRTIGEADVEAWHDVLGDISFADAKTAVKDHYRESNDWIMPAMIRKAVRKIRADRINKAPQVDPPADMTPVETIEWLRTTRRAIADGTYQAPAPPELKQRDMRQLEGVFKEVGE